MKLRYFESVIFCPSWFRTLGSPLSLSFLRFTLLHYFLNYHPLLMFSSRSDAFLYSTPKHP